MTDTETALHCAVHIANVVIREDKAGHVHDADRAHARLHALVDRQPDPDQFLIKLARKLGRDRSAAIMIDPAVWDAA